MSGTPRSPEAGAIRDALAFSLLRGIGAVAFREAVERHGGGAAALHAAPHGVEREEALRRADDILARAERAGARLLVLGEASYPDVLADLSDPPPVLFAIGDGRLCDGRRVGIVGTRQSSGSGERHAHRLAAAVAGAGGVVVSGMALGIDAAAHRGALDAAGGTIAVLGGGADLPYPPSHAALHERMVRQGLVLSEAAPGSRPVKGAFPRRNRIIAALSDVLIVVEAGRRSGALITAALALELGRPVAALPGPIDSPRHAGTNQLLAAGAQFIATVEDALQLAGLAGTPRGAVTGTAPEAAPAAGARGEAERAVLLAVRRGASDADAIAGETGLSPRDVGAALSVLQLLGEVRTGHDGSVLLGS